MTLILALMGSCQFVPRPPEAEAGSDSGTLTMDHANIPLVGVHTLACESCHATADGGDDLDGQSRYCWNCHEDARPAGGHYASEVDPTDPFFRWDCGPCHSLEPGFSLPFRLHAPRVPHGAVISDVAIAGACTTTPEENWVVACADCHPDEDNLAVFECSTCHADIHGDAYTDDLCLACHTSAGPAQSDSRCDSLLD